MTDPNNPLNITDEDIGKEGRFLYGSCPAVLIGLSRDKNGGVIRDAAFKRTHADGSEEINLCGPAYRGITRIPRKLYIGVERASKTGDDVLNTTLACSTRELVRRSAPAGWTIIEIPHPEDAP